MGYRKKWKKTKNFVYKHSTAENAKKALTLALMTKKLLNVEYKQVDKDSQVVGVGTTASIYGLNSCGQGDTNTDRNGLSVRFKSLNLQYTVNRHASATLTKLRVVVYIDRAPHGTLSTYTDLYKDNTTQSNINIINTGRFQILYSKLHYLDNLSKFTTQGHLSRSLNLVTKYENAAATDDDIMRNQICIAFLSDDNTNTPGVTFTSRTTFIDN